MGKLEITLKKGYNKASKKQIATIKALGLNKIGSSVVQQDNTAINGMINKISHLVEYKKI